MVQSSPNQQDPDREHSNASNMEDSTAMTIEFLRARLLTERSVSKAARQRADELAKRVLDLEEQLKIVSFQRKKAEKATTDVLAILENHGICKFSDEFDSASEQEVTFSDSKVRNNTQKEEEISVGSKIMNNDSDGYSGSELESSPLPGRSLSWRSGRDSSSCHEMKCINSSARRQRQSTYGTIASASLRRRVGKSCRQIRRKATRSAMESQIDSSMPSPQEDGGATCSEGFHAPSEKQEQKTSLEVPNSGILTEEPVNNDSYQNGHGSKRDMERALKHQSQLIGQYEEEEKAQREWEEKFKENNGSPLDSCEPGCHSDITEERDETKALAALDIASEDQEANLKVEGVCLVKEPSIGKFDGFRPDLHGNVETIEPRKCSNVSSDEFPASDVVSHITGGRQDEWTTSFQPSNGSHGCSCSNGSAGDHSLNAAISHGSSNFHKGDALSKVEHHAMVPCETHSEVGSVLEALSRAKLSLKHKFNALLPIDQMSFRKAFEPADEIRLQIPVGCAGLFRVPSDPEFETTATANILSSNFRLRLTNYYPGTGHSAAGDPFMTIPYRESSSSASTGYTYPTVPIIGNVSSIPTTEPLGTLPRFSPCKLSFEHHSNAIAAADPFMSSPYTESKVTVSIGDRYPAIPINPYIPTREPLESWSRISSHRLSFQSSSNSSFPSPSRYAHNDPTTDAGLKSSGRFTFPYSPLLPNLMSRMPPTEGPSSGMEIGMPQVHLPSYAGPSRPNTNGW